MSENMGCENKLFCKLFFENYKDEEEFNNYLNYKGIFLYKHIYDVFLIYRNKVNYNELSSYVKYDKGLRNVLYKYLSAVEEYYRSKLINSFDISEKINDPYNCSVESKQLVKTSGMTSNLYYFTFSKHFTFTKLLDLLNNKKYLKNDENIDLRKISRFRNKVMHYNLIITSFYVTKRKIEKNIKEVEKNCELIYKYLPKPMQNCFQKSINKCNHLTNKNREPNLKILCLGEMKNGIFN